MSKTQPPSSETNHLHTTTPPPPHPSEDLPGLFSPLLQGGALHQEHCLISHTVEGNDSGGHLPGSVLVLYIHFGAAISHGHPLGLVDAPSLERGIRLWNPKASGVNGLTF